jgi:uncharacterized protein (DUF433 family)
MGGETNEVVRDASGARLVPGQRVSLETFDGRSEEGITVGLLDSVILVCRAAAGRRFAPPPVKAALERLRSDPDVLTVLGQSRSGGEAAEPDPADDEAPSWSSRLTFDRAVSETSLCVKGARVTADQVISYVIDGWTWSDILSHHPVLTEDDIRACLAYAMDKDSGVEG